MKKLLFVVVVFFTMAVSAQIADPLAEVREKIKNYQYAQAINLLNEILQSDSINTEAYLLKASSLKELYRYSDALAAIKKGLSQDTANNVLISELATVYNLTGDYQHSFETYSRLALQYPENPYFILQMANALYATDAFLTAKKLYTGLLHQDSLNTWYLRQAGFCYYELNMPDSAIWYFNKTLTIQNNDLAVLSKLTTLYLNKKEYTAGLSLTEDLREKDSTRKELNKLSGYFYYLLKQYEPAIIRFHQYLSQCRPSEPEKFGNKYLGLSLYKTENFQDASKYFYKAYQADSTDTEVCFYLGVSYCRSLYSTEGIFYLNKALSLILPSPNYLAKIYSEIGDAYNIKGEYLLALDYISKSWKADTTDTDWLFKIAYQYDYYLDDIQTALGYYQQHITLTAGLEENTEEMSYQDFSRKRVKEIPKGISISNHRKQSQ